MVGGKRTRTIARFAGLAEQPVRALRAHRSRIHQRLQDLCWRGILDLLIGSLAPACIRPSEAVPRAAGYQLRR